MVQIQYRLVYENDKANYIFPLEFTIGDNSYSTKNVEMVLTHTTMWEGQKVYGQKGVFTVLTVCTNADCMAMEPEGLIERKQNEYLHFLVVIPDAALSTGNTLENTKLTWKDASFYPIHTLSGTEAVTVTPSEGKVIITVALSSLYCNLCELTIQNMLIPFVASGGRLLTQKESLEFVLYITPTKTITLEDARMSIEVWVVVGVLVSLSMVIVCLVCRVFRCSERKRMQAETEKKQMHAKNETEKKQMQAENKQIQADKDKVSADMAKVLADKEKVSADNERMRL